MDLRHVLGELLGEIQEETLSRHPDWAVNLDWVLAERAVFGEPDKKWMTDEKLAKNFQTHVRPCEHCKNLFYAERSKVRYCSHRCARAPH